MAEREPYAPLTTAIVRGLSDKLYEKRKAAAIEIEKMVRDYLGMDQRSQMEKLLNVLGSDFALSPNQNIRKGGLIGLAAIAIAMEKESSMYVNELVKPVMASFYDQDSRIRYYACEALYNIAKVTRGSILIHFNDIFDNISKLTADPDQNVKKGIEILDRLLKDIVGESSSFNLEEFIPLLRERIYTKNTFARQFIVSWVATLDSIPDINMLVFLPEILDGLFIILGDQNQEIRKMCESTLVDFLRTLRLSQTGVNFSAMTNILIVHSQSSDHLIQYTAIIWLKEFVQLSGRQMLHFVSGIISAILPCLSVEDIERRNIREAAKAMNHSMKRLIGPEDDLDLTKADDKTEADDENQTDKTESEKKDVEIPHLLQQSNGPVIFDVETILKVLTLLLNHDAILTRIAALRWLWHLLHSVPNKTFKHIESVFPVLLDKLSDQSDEVVLLVLESLAEISSNPAGQSCPPRSVSLDMLSLLSPDPKLKSPPKTNSRQSSPKQKTPIKQKTVEVKKAVSPTATVQKVHLNHYFTKFINELTCLFRRDPQLLDDRGSFIIRQLAVLLNAEDIFRSLSERLLLEENLTFTTTMVRTLNTILLTSTELYHLRSQLKDLKTKESCGLFCCLYKSWCHSPIATVTLCYLTQNYKHACDVTLHFGNLEVTVDFLKEIDKLVQLIESPIFAYLRLQLLDVRNSQYLIKSLYGLLMLLPQSEAFKLLHYRLQCIPHYHLAPPNSPTHVAETRDHVSKIDFDELLQHFITVQEKHRAYKSKSKKLLFSSDSISNSRESVI